MLQGAHEECSDGDLSPVWQPFKEPAQELLGSAGWIKGYSGSPIVNPETDNGCLVNPI